MSEVEEEDATWHHPAGHDGSDQITPGGGWEYEPAYVDIRPRLTWSDRIRLAFWRLIRR